MSENNLSAVTASQLSKYLDSPSYRTTTLVIDCRSFTAYNTGHITGAHNIYCPPILKRRCTDGIPLNYIVRAAEVRESLLRGEFVTVVFYDEASLSLEGIAGSSDVHLAMAAIEKASEKSPVSMQLLKGGFDTFSMLYDGHCTWPTRSTTAPGQLSLSSPGFLAGHHLTISHGASQSLLGPLSAGRLPPVVPFRNVLNMCGKSERPASENNCKDENGPDEIRPWLYLGTMQQASRRDYLTTLGITALLNVAAITTSQEPIAALRATDQRSPLGDSSSTGEIDQRSSKTGGAPQEVSQRPLGMMSGTFSYMSIPLRDNATADIARWFPQCIKFIEEVRRSGGKVLVHCQAGISRSAAICIAYLMQQEGLSMDAAHDYIKARRSVIAPNLNFMRQLYEFESQLRRRHLAAVTAVATPRFTRSPRRYNKLPSTACLTLSPCTPESVSPRGAVGSLFVFDDNSSTTEIKERRLRPSYSILSPSRYYYRQFVPASTFSSTTLLADTTTNARTVEKSCCMFDLSKGSSPGSILCPPIIPSQ